MPSAPPHKIVAVDFDGTVVKHRFPEIGLARRHAISTLLQMQRAGIRVILNTCRENQPERRYLDEAVLWLLDRSVRPWSVNGNRTEDLPWATPVTRAPRKVYADVYIDDRNVGGFPGWKVVRNELIHMGWLPRRP